MVLRFTGAGVSDVGRVRPHNWGKAAVTGPYAVLVADGVGGAAAGEIASATAAYSASAVALGWLGELPELVIAEAYAAATAGVRMGVQRDLERLGMATTLTMLVTDGRDVALGHLGDSRAYLLRGRRAEHGEPRSACRQDAHVLTGLGPDAEHPGRLTQHVDLVDRA